jgi:O-antigen biosynthesis protein
VGETRDGRGIWLLDRELAHLFDHGHQEREEHRRRPRERPQIGMGIGSAVSSRPNSKGATARLAVRQTFSAVTGACMLISGACRAATGNFDEETFAIAYNDIDYCLRAGRPGFRTVWTPFATLTHHESASRGSDEAPANADRFRREQEALRTKYGLDDYVDRAFNPWYGRHSSKPGPASLEELPEPR